MCALTEVAVFESRLASLSGRQGLAVPLAVEHDIGTL
jgi:hypothetical protein